MSERLPVNLFMSLCAYEVSAVSRSVFGEVEVGRGE